MSFLQVYLLSVLLLIVSTFGLQTTFLPGIKGGHKTTLVSIFILCGVLIALHAVIFVLTQRPLFSSGVCLVAVLVIGGVSNAKYAALKEPLVFTDFYLYLQAFKYPRLYLPFLKLIPIIVVIITALGVIALGISIEESGFSWISWQSLALMILAWLSLLATRQLAQKVCISEDVSKDSQKYGVLVTLILYAAQSSINHQKLQKLIASESPFNSVTNQSNLSKQNSCDLVVVQSESFFDARSLSQNIKQDVLEDYDQVISNSIAHGQLRVPAWGANTMRTEFAFLSGLNPAVLGLSQYYPYQQLLRYQLPSLLTILKLKGYRCICIHPHASGFFKRDVFFEQLGFDEFIDEAEFVHAKREGPYIADAAITQKIKETLDTAEQPCFIFAITMENHGPLHMEKVMEEEWRNYFHDKPDKSLGELVVYLRHLKNANKMVLELSNYLKSRKRNSLLAFYGDHVPAISSVFRQLKYDDSRSNYFIWSNKGSVQSDEAKLKERELAAEELAPALVGMLSGIQKINGKDL